jgi:hypothetical protein
MSGAFDNRFHGRKKASGFRLQGIPMYIGTGFRLQATEDVR